MMTRIALLLSFSLLRTALAFEGTTPVVVWGSESSALDHLPASLHTSGLTSISLLESILLPEHNEQVCSLDAVVIITHGGLHASHLRSLPSNSHIARSIERAGCSRQFPYAPHNTSNAAPHPSSIAKKVARYCSAAYLEVDLAVGMGFEREGSMSGKGLKVALVTVPEMSVEGHLNAEMERFDEHIGTTIFPELVKYPNHLVVYTGSSPSPLSSLYKRQSAGESKHALESDATKPKVTKGGILHKYQLLTPGLIVSISLVLFVLLPILWAALKALASVESPLMAAPPKNFSAESKKDQ